MEGISVIQLEVGVNMKAKVGLDIATQGGDNVIGESLGHLLFKVLHQGGRVVQAPVHHEANVADGHHHVLQATGAGRVLINLGKVGWEQHPIPKQELARADLMKSADCVREETVSGNISICEKRINQLTCPEERPGFQSCGKCS